MISLNSELLWSSDDAAALRAFLASPSGKRLVEALVFYRPSFEASSASMESSFARARDIAGYERCVENLVGLTNPITKSEPTASELQERNYPPPEDDRYWDE